MINLRKMTIKEINEKPFLINQINDLYGTVEASFFEYTYNDEVRWLYSYGQHCTIVAINGKYIDYASFMVDDDYNLTYMEYDDFCVYHQGDEGLVVLDEGSNVSESLSMLRRKTMNDSEQDGVIIHKSINNKTYEQMVVAYLCVYRDQEYYFPFNFEKPFFVAFLKGRKKEKYLLYETDSDYFSYDVITIKEFGLLDVLRNGSFTLQKEESIRRYFKVRYENKVGDCVLLMPFSRPMKIEELDKLIESKGFKREVGKNTLDYYNGLIKEKDEFYALVEAIKEHDKAIDKRIEKKLN